MTDQSLTSLFPSPASSASRDVVNFQCPKISHFNFCFQSDRINVKVGKNFKIYLNNLMIKSNYSTITLSSGKRFSILTESSSIPTKVNVVQGRTVFSCLMGIPRVSAMLRNLLRLDKQAL